MQSYFIRHGQSTNNLLWDTTGCSRGRSHDPELTEAGQRQAELAARFLAYKDPEVKSNGRDYYNASGFGLTHLYTSLMVRAVATGAVIARALQLPLIAWHELHEAGGLFLADGETGKLVGQPGSSRSYLERHYPSLVLPDSCDESGWWNRPFEEEAQAMARTRGFVDELLKRHGKTEDRVGVISHGDFYNLMLRVLFKMESDAGWFTLNNVGVTRIDFKGDQVDLVYANRVDFLPKDLVT